MNKEVKQLPYKETLSSLGLPSLERRKQEYNQGLQNLRGDV